MCASCIVDFSPAIEAHNVEKAVGHCVYIAFIVTAAISAWVVLLQRDVA